MVWVLVIVINVYWGLRLEKEIQKTIYEVKSIKLKLFVFVLI